MTIDNKKPIKVVVEKYSIPNLMLGILIFVLICDIYGCKWAEGACHRVYTCFTKEITK